ncbi:MAG: hypothetical protein WKG07_00850 [Hymenobacter sp.]
MQIAPYGSSDKTRSGPRLREAQFNAMKVIPNSGMASTPPPRLLGAREYLRHQGHRLRRPRFSRP